MEYGVTILFLKMVDLAFTALVLPLRLGPFLENQKQKEGTWVSSHEYSTSDDPGLERSMCFMWSESAYAFSMDNNTRCWSILRPPIIDCFCNFYSSFFPPPVWHPTKKENHFFSFRKWTVQMFKQVVCKCIYIHVCYVYI